MSFLLALLPSFSYSLWIEGLTLLLYLLSLPPVLQSLQQRLVYGHIYISSKSRRLLFLISMSAICVRKLSPTQCRNSRCFLGELQQVCESLKSPGSCTTCDQDADAYCLSEVSSMLSSFWQGFVSDHQTILLLFHHPVVTTQTCLWFCN